MALGMTERRLINKVTKKIYTVVWIDGENVFLERGDSFTFLTTTSALMTYFDPLVPAQQ